MRKIFLNFLAALYQGLKKILFLFDPELVHETIVGSGEVMSKIPGYALITGFFFNPQYSKLTQRIGSLTFRTPLGLAAGFDYEARLTQTLHPLGFGFQSVGTITNQPCEGNTKPRLSRLPKSKSLLVNKGFRNPGATLVVAKLKNKSFNNLVGISIGQTNTSQLQTRKQVLDDITNAFKKFKKSSVKHHYYELNISCPNISTDFNFYEPKHLDTLLTMIDELQLRKPVFVKMPISEPDEVFIKLLKVISKHSPVGIIVGNLQKNRHDSSVVKSEIKNLGKGNLSGKPTFARSNHLIALAYKQAGKELVIIGCGGVFSAKDAYQKIKLGASVVQMITGMIFQGPQVIAQINHGLNELIERDGYTHISQAIGIENKQYFKQLN